MNDLEKARRRMDEIDRELAKLFDERMKTVREISEYKRAHALPLYDRAREEEILRKCAEFSRDSGTAPYSRAFFENLLKLSKDYQKELSAKEDKKSEKTRKQSEKDGKT